MLLSYIGMHWNDRGLVGLRNNTFSALKMLCFMLWPPLQISNQQHQRQVNTLELDMYEPLNIVLKVSVLFKMMVMMMCHKRCFNLTKYNNFCGIHTYNDRILYCCMVTVLLGIPVPRRLQSRITWLCTSDSFRSNIYAGERTLRQPCTISH